MFVEFFRNTPVLVQILWFYFALPILLPFSISPLAAASLGISLNSAAFSAEIYRGGIQSIDRGQWDGARAIGMSWVQAMRRIILPQALKRMTPALTNRAIEIFKMSTLASAVAYVELLQQGKLIASLNFNPIEAYTAVARDLLRLPLAAGAVHLRARAAPAEGRMTLLKVEGLAKRFGATDVLRGVDLDVQPGRAHRHPGRLGLGQEHLAALPQLHGDAGRRHRDARRPGDRPARERAREACASASAWCSSSSTSSRT